MITSVQNDHVKLVRSLARRRVREREQLFVVEGTRLAEEVVRAGIEPALVLYTEAWAAGPAGQRLLLRLTPATQGAWAVAEHVMAAASDTETPQGILLAVPTFNLPPRPGVILILDAIRDPGNLGTILRSAEATAAGQVLLAPGTADAYNPKAVRGAMGAHFRLPIETLDWPAIAGRISGLPVWLAETDGELPYDRVDWTVPAALIVGGEAEGAGPQSRALARGTVKIPMAGGAESLNAAMAATVLLFEAARQRRELEIRNQRLEI